MALAVTHFEFIQPNWDRLRYSADGIVGRDMDRRGDYVATMARAQVGVRTGNLRSTIQHKTYGSVDGPYSVVSAGGPRAPYALMHHEGTRPHQIVPRAKRGMLKFTVGGRTVYATRVMHPGTRANKYLTDHLNSAVRI